MITSAQLLALGLSSHEIQHRQRSGKLHRLGRGVYAVGHLAVGREARFLAAVLGVGRDAALSHVSAGALWGVVDLQRLGRVPIDVSATRKVRQRPGVRVHIDRRLGPHDVTDRCGVPVTTSARTLLDLAGSSVDEEVLRRAVREAQVQRLVDEDRLRRQLSYSRGHSGTTRLAALVRDGPTPTRSTLEDRTLELLLSHGFPPPAINVVPPGLPRRVEVDFLFAEQHVVVEADGARYHDNRLARQTDAERQAMLEAAGYRVVRLDWSQVTRSPAQTVQRLRHVLAGR